MRSPAASILALALALLAAPAAAQQTAFEGTVTFQTDHGGTMMYSVWKGLARMDVGTQHGAVATIIDPAKKTLLILLPDQKMYMQKDLPDAPAPDTHGGADSAFKLTNTGKTDVVAGVKCEIWHAVSSSGTTDVCAARDMGGFFPGNAMRNEPPPAWAQGLRGNFFPLRVTDATGKMLLLATKVEAKKFDASYFAVPAGFTKLDIPAGMPGMPTMGGPPTH